jgi:hypothetical protein
VRPSIANPRRIHARLNARRCPRIKVAPSANNVANNHTHFHGAVGGFGPSQIAERAVVLTITLIGADADPLRLMDVGFTVQVASSGAPLQVKPTDPERPPRGVILSL